MTPAWFAAAAIALGQALQLDEGFYSGAALAWLTVALVCAALGAGGRRDARDRRAIVTSILVFGIAWQLADQFLTRPGRFVVTNDLRPFRAGILVEGAIVAIGLLLPRRRVRALWLPALVLVHLVLGCWMIRVAPSPGIDVIAVHNAAWDALKHGHNPYAITFADIYGTGQYYARGAVSGGRVQFGYPYPPISLLLVLPGYLFGDYRYASLAAMAGAALLMASARPTQTARLAAALFLTTPRIFFVLEQGWSEPVSVLLVALTVFVMTRGERLTPWIAGLTIASKQYLVVAVPLLWRYATRRERSVVRFFATAGLAAALVTLPFVLWGPRAFAKDVLLLQFHEPFRVDALSYLGWLARHGWREPSFVWTGGAMILAVALAVRRSGDSPSAWSGALAFVSMATFAFGRKAFCNYYFFVVGGLCLAVAAAYSVSPDMMANKERNPNELPVRPGP